MRGASNVWDFRFFFADGLAQCLALFRADNRRRRDALTLELLADYTVVLLQFTDGCQLWLYPELSTVHADWLAALDFPSPQLTLRLS